MSTAVAIRDSPAPTLDLGGPLALEAGGVLPRVTVAYEAWGELGPRADNAVLVCHALTGSSHAGGDDGWWEGLIGPGRALDTRRFFVVCANLLGSCYGSTGPLCRDPRTGRPYGPAFPLVTPRDMVAAQAALLDRLGVRSLAAVVGGSLGGMLVWQWLVDHPERVRRGVPIASTPRATAWTIGLNAVAREAILGDPEWNDGCPGPGFRGLDLARRIAMLSYRSPAELEARFGRRARGEPDGGVPARGARWEVASYLRRHGEKLVRRFDPASYLALTDAMDRHDISRGLGDLDRAFRRIRSRVLAIGISSDVLFPPSDLAQSVRRLLRLGIDARYSELASIHGHDAFLIELDAVGDLIGGFLAEPEGGTPCAC